MSIWSVHANGWNWRKTLPITTCAAKYCASCTNGMPKPHKLLQTLIHQSLRGIAMQNNKGFKVKQLTLGVLLALSFGQQVQAEEAPLPEYTLFDAIKEGKNLTSFRLRYENV